MPRTRNIKPGFFTNEELASLPPLVRILFAGLWCWADREGRLEDRPKRLKANILPYDECDVDEMLNQLEISPSRFIVRYQVDGCNYIQVNNFRKNQHCHNQEVASVIPEYAPDKNGARTVLAPNKHRTTPEQAPNNTRTSTEPIRLVACSLNLESCSLNPVASSLELVNTGASPKSVFKRPSVEDVLAHLDDKGYHFDAESFVAYYESQGWKKANGQRLTNWKSACTTWEQKWRKDNPEPRSRVATAEDLARWNPTDGGSIAGGWKL